MIARVVAASLLMVSLAAGQDWQSRLSSPAPGPFPPPKPVKAKYEFGWSAFKAGESTAEFSHTPAGELELHVVGKTIGVVRGMWRMNSDAVSVADARTLRPIKLEQTEEYRDESRKTVLTFDEKGVTRSRKTTPTPPKREKIKRFKFPNVFELQSAWLWVRSQPLKNKDVLRFVAYPATAPYYGEVEVVKREQIKVAGKKYKAIKLALRLQKIDDDDMTLKPHKKFKRAHAWFSDDEDRLLLKVEADVFVGSVWMEMQSVEFKGNGS